MSKDNNIKRVFVICPQCQTSTYSDKIYCPNCGTDLLRYLKIRYLLENDVEIHSLDEKYGSCGVAQFLSIGGCTIPLMLIYQNNHFYHIPKLNYLLIAIAIFSGLVFIIATLKKRKLYDILWDKIDNKLECS